MRALLDTNIFLWFISGNDKLSDAAKIFIVKLQFRKRSAAELVS